jgi:hypothetical protein
MYAGVQSVGAEDAWWSTALDLERHEMEGTPYVAGSIDIAKCFDQMNNNEQLCKSMLIYTLQLLKSKAKSHSDLCSEPINVNKVELYELLCSLCSQFHNKSSIIPVLIVYTYFQVIEQHGLISLKAHNSPDVKGKSYGDIEIWNTYSDCPHTVIEIKHGLEIKESFLQTFSTKVKNKNTNNFLLTSLPYQRYDFNYKHSVVCWNVASYVHYNLYNKECVDEYIDTLHTKLMKSNLELAHKENLKKLFHI